MSSGNPVPAAYGRLEEQGFEPWAFRMQSGRSATELHPLAVIEGRGRGTSAAFFFLASASARFFASATDSFDMAAPPPAFGGRVSFGKLRAAAPATFV